MLRMIAKLPPYIYDLPDNFSRASLRTHDNGRIAVKRSAVTSARNPTTGLLAAATLAAVCLSPTTATAVTIYECEDEQGNRTFQERCPPGTKPVQQKRYGSPAAPAPAGDEAAAAEPAGDVTLYRIPECETCDLVREYLAVRNIPYVEKSVHADVDLQLELKNVAGDLRVPATLIGEQIIFGYDRNALHRALVVSGHVEGGAESGAEVADEETPEDGTAAGQQPE
jgi:glutaredoxin